MNDMRLLNEGYERVTKLLHPMKMEPDAQMRLSIYCLMYTEYGVNLVKNTLTGQVWASDAEEWAALSSPGKARAEVLTALAKHRLLVPEGRDELNDYLSALQILRMMDKSASGYEKYIIFPTTGCNARCVYCFEKDFVPTTMTRETARDVADYIDRTRGTGPIKIQWFGGEPLAATPRIDDICGELTRKDIAFSSSIITNASLVTSELARRMADEWHLKKAQVSLDGARADYEARKRYARPAIHNYDAALNGARVLAEAGIRVSLRCNYDADNLNGLEAFVDDIAARFGGMENVSLYFTSLYQTREAGAASELIRTIRTLEDRAVSLRLYRAEKKSKASMPLNYCMADSMDRSVVIDPKGDLYNCEHLPGDDCFGNVRDGVADDEKFRALIRPHGVEPCCRECPFLPECTPFYKKGCPMGQWHCREIKQAEAENALHRIARRERERLNGEAP